MAHHIHVRYTQSSFYRFHFPPKKNQRYNSFFDADVNDDTIPFFSDADELSKMLRRCSAGTKRKRKGKATVSKQEDEGDVNHETRSPKEDQGDPSVHERVPPLPSNPTINGKAIFIVENAALNKGFVKKAGGAVRLNDQELSGKGNLGKDRGRETSHSYNGQRRWKILNTEEDNNFLLRQKKNLGDYRSDIVYKVLRAILDSPLNKAGMVEAIYVKTTKGALFEVKPHVRIPRTLKRFCGLMLELLEKKYVRNKDTQETLLRVVEEPVTRYLPSNSRIIGLSPHSEKVVDIEGYVSAASDDLNLIFVVGAMVGGKINGQGTDDFISVSEYPLEAKWCTELTCEALEEKWNIY
ncbi:ribosomal RNA small subunit methyltransferase NEP1-like [Rhododendron vialii]|uniref:ribosomal RNA small subunit methyltransferase NEP1-like n=1 Tax=Rhododendron vialii TaxID=182163 RepID=UPI00265FCEB4|nr:ribosomal RNA small subunit methyltransferase NEP1-like [Rhododendron vialii]